MARLVLKFGGTSVADADAINRSAAHVIREADAGHHLLVVVSAMAGETNRLLAISQQICEQPDKAEQDVICASGEQITAALMVLALQNKGKKAQSMMGWQIPLKTDKLYGKARIKDVDTKKVEKLWQEKFIIVVAGFQGINEDDRIVTLGRGGSDLTAVALAAKFNAEQCDIYTDVSGIHVTDPRIVPSASKMDAISYEEMLEMSSLGAKVLQSRSIEMAFKYKVSLQVRSSLAPPCELEPFYKVGIGPGTFVVDEDKIMEKQIVSGITYQTDEAKITIVGVHDTPGKVARIFGEIAAQNVNVDMIVQGPTVREGKCNVTFTIPEEDLQTVIQTMGKIQKELGFDEFLYSQQVTKISIIGIGMRTNSGVAAKMFKLLADQAINIESISTSEIKTSVLINKNYTELAVRILHEAYELGSSDGDKLYEKK